MPPLKIIFKKDPLGKKLPKNDATVNRKIESQIFQKKKIFLQFLDFKIFFENFWGVYD